MSTRSAFGILIVLGSLCLLGSVTAAQSPASKLKQSFDQTFVTKAAQAGLAEVDQGQIAVKRGANQAVKDFGQKMIDDHSKANDELKTIAHNKNFSLPSEPNATQKASLDKLDKLSGVAFDATYVKGAKTDHLQAIQLFEQEVKKGTDPDLKAFATKTLPTIREHYKMLQNLKP